MRYWNVLSIFWLCLCAVIAGGFLFSNLINAGKHSMSIEIYGPILGSLSYGFGSTIIAILVGTMAAIYFECYKGKQYVIAKFLFALPLAFPIYVFAFIYVGAFEYSSAIGSFFRGAGVELPSLRNIVGASVVTGMCLYPYVFLIVGAHLRVVFPKYFWNAKSLGLSDSKIILKVLLPALKPSIMAGGMLVMFESLADFGAVQTFGLKTLTTAIYSQWFGMQDFMGGSRLAVVLLGIVVGLIFLQKYFFKETNIQKIQKNLKAELKANEIFFRSFVVLVALLAIAFPFTQLLFWADLTQLMREFSVNNIFLNSLFLASIGSLVIVLIGTAIAFSIIQNNKLNKLINLTTYGYALPGSLIAVVIMVGFNMIFPISITSLGIMGLILALSIRFLTPAKNYISESIALIPKSTIHALAIQNTSPMKSFFKIYWKHIRMTSLMVFFIVAIEILKEQPAVLLLRPAGFDTLSSRIYNYTSEGQWELAAQPSILLVLAGVIFVIMLTKVQHRYE